MIEELVKEKDKWHRRYNDAEIEIDRLKRENKAYELAIHRLIMERDMAINGVVHLRHGQWIPYEYGDYHWHKCSVCGVADEYIETVHRDGYPDKDLERIRHYCPNCGASMDEER